VSRSAISSSSDAKLTASAAAALRVYYCLCGEFIVVMDKNLANLPRRRTDGAIILRSKDSGKTKAVVFKLNCTIGDPVMIERSGRLERQHQFFCPRCKLLVGYQSTPPPIKSGPFVYIHRGALTQIQGQLPPDAFDGEEELVSVLK